MGEENNNSLQSADEGSTTSNLNREEPTTNGTEKVNQGQSIGEGKSIKSEEPTPRASVGFSMSLLHKRLEEASKGYEEILRIIHSTNLKNAVLVKKNFYEIELICKNALLELKGL